MRTIYIAAFILLLMSGFNAKAQSVVNWPTQLEIIPANDAGNPDVESSFLWYLENGGISNAAGEGVAALKGNSGESLQAFFIALQQESSTLKFDLSQESSQLVLSLRGVNPSDLSEVLAGKLRAFAASQAGTTPK
ncbi:MAG: hypothetical protein H6581_19735 [Bacteroidia bacterium]|nr:hypothetical protein [Bacteroidia bacterium]